MPHDSFDIRLQDIGGAARTTVLVSGEVDLAAQEPLERCLERAGAGRESVTVDLSAVTFIDSGGLRTLLEANARQREAGLSLVLRAPSPAVRRALDTIGVGPLLEIEDSP